jgi:hypothetical protein
MTGTYHDKLPPFPKLSPNFTLEDIRKVRDYDAVLSGILTQTEQQQYISDAADNVERIIMEKRAKGIKPTYPKRIEV